MTRTIRTTPTASLAIAALFSVTFLLPSLASAAPIFNNFGPAFTYNTSNYNLVGNAFDGNNYAEGDTFTPSATAKFGTLDIALSCFAACPATFTVSLNQDSGADSPGAVIESFTVAGLSLGPTGSNNAVLVLNSVLFPTLTGGTQYWVSVSSDTKNSIGWNHNVTGDPSDQAISTDGGATYFSPSFLTPGAYEVDSFVSTSTPEPSSLIMMVGALPFLLLLRRRAG